MYFHQTAHIKLTKQLISSQLSIFLCLRGTSRSSNNRCIPDLRCDYWDWHFADFYSNRQSGYWFQRCTCVRPVLAKTMDMLSSYVNKLVIDQEKSFHFKQGYHSADIVGFIQIISVWRIAPVHKINGNKFLHMHLENIVEIVWPIFFWHYF